MHNTYKSIPKFEHTHVFWIALLINNLLGLEFQFNRISNSKENVNDKLIVEFPCIFSFPETNDMNVNKKNMLKFKDTNHKLTLGYKKYIFQGLKTHLFKSRIAN